MQYEYDDDFIVNSLPQEELERYETMAANEVAQFGFENEFYVKNLTICRTYMLAARAQIEADGMDEKYKVYKEEFDRYMKQAVANAAGNKKSGSTSIKTAPIGRG